MRGKQAVKSASTASHVPRSGDRCFACGSTKGVRMVVADWRCMNCQADVKDPAALWRDDEGYTWHQVGDVLCGGARLPAFDLCGECAQLGLSNLRPEGRSALI